MNRHTYILLLSLFFVVVSSCNLDELRFEPLNINKNFSSTDYQLTFLPQVISIPNTKTCRVRLPISIARFDNKNNFEGVQNLRTQNIYSIPSQLLNGTLTTLLECTVDSVLIKPFNGWGSGKRVLIIDQSTRDSIQRYWALINFYNKIPYNKPIDVYGCASNNNFIKSGWKKYFSAGSSKESYVKSMSYLCSENYGTSNSTVALLDMIESGEIQTGSIVTLFTTDNSISNAQAEQLITFSLSRNIKISVVGMGAYSSGNLVKDYRNFQCICNQTGGGFKLIASSYDFYNSLNSLSWELYNDYNYYEIVMTLSCTKPIFYATPNDYSDHYIKDLKITPDSAFTIFNQNIYLFI